MTSPVASRSIKLALDVEIDGAIERRLNFENPPVTSRDIGGGGRHPPTAGGVRE